jgi:hypothetical protein
MNWFWPEIETELLAAAARDYFGVLFNSRLSLQIDRFFLPCGEIILED